MSCDGCSSKVEKTLNAIDGISAVVTLEPPIATITMEKHIPIEQLQTALTAAGNYTIEMFNNQNIADKKETTVETKSCCSSHNKQTTDIKPFPKNSSGKYYCPMHCEGDKMYDKAGNCPVCGMNLEKVPELTVQKTQYTCPMHPEIIRDVAGACPICGMDLIPITTAVSEEDNTYKELSKK
jgi:Cu+-exporting ATPase